MTADVTSEPRTVADVFKADTADHQMTVLQDDGEYRHLRFAEPGPNGWHCWFELVTWPGSLAIRGDHGSFVFSRVDDMFTFFRRPGGDTINPGYWAEKEQTGAKTKGYSEDVFRKQVVDHFVDSVRNGEAPRGLGKALREDIFDSYAYDISFEEPAREALSDFSFKGYRFHDTWEWDFTDWDHHYLWCCHAVAWGIRQYDDARQLVEVAS
jgi:hypothetical protein